jgi:hypothetical protein
MLRMKTKVENGKLYEMTHFKYRCNLCSDIVESLDKKPVYCKCKNLSICGGLEYGGLVTCLDDFITDYSEWKLISCEKCEPSVKHN